MIDERFLFGVPVDFNDVCLIYAPTNKDIISFGYNNFWELISPLLISYEDLYDAARMKARKEDRSIDEYKILTPWENLWHNIEQSNLQMALKMAIKLFTKEDSTFLVDQRIIIIGPVEERRIINEENYFDFQNIIRSSVGLKQATPPNLKMHPKLREMKAKQRERDRVKAKQEGKNFSFSAMLLNCCCLNVGLNLDNILDRTYVVTSELYKMGSKKEKYEIDILSLIHGADSKNVKLESWREMSDDN